MPCNSSHMEPNALEKEHGVVLDLLTELDEGKAPDPKEFGNGFHKDAYCRYTPKEEVDKLTAKLCKKLRLIGEDAISEMSLEMQTWWRDHKTYDESQGR